MWNRERTFVLAILLLLPAAVAWAGDEEGCLFCHRLELRVAREFGGKELRVSDPTGGAHDPLYCSDCHPDARLAPHGEPPGPARCLGECHGSPSAQEAHSRAAFGGLTDAHRKLSAPRAPCLGCHRGTDRPKRIDEILARCGGCHPRERESVAAGVHRRMPGALPSGACTGCHVAHKAGDATAAAAKRANCAGPGCHDGVTEGMRRFGGHAPGGQAGRSGRTAGGAAVSLVFALAGGVTGLLVRGGRGGGA